MNKDSRKHIVIVGAGIIGSSIGYHLAKAGNRVTIVDSKTPCSGASGASDGSISVASKSTETAIKLAVESKKYYELLSQNGQLLDGVYHPRNTNFVVTNIEEFKAATAQVEKLRNNGVKLDLIDNKNLRKQYPFLSSKVTAIYEIWGEGHALGYQVVDKFLNSQYEIKVLSNCSVKKIIYSSDQSTALGVHTTHGDILADEIIVANGIGATHLIPQLKIIANKGILVVTDRLRENKLFKNLLIFASYLIEKHQFGSTKNSTHKGALFIDPLQSGQLLLGTTRLHNADPRHADIESVKKILKLAISYFPSLETVDVIRVFAGIRAATPDKLPYLGPIASINNLWVATGFEGDGICLAPLIGRELSNWIHGKPTIELLSQLSPNRLFLSNQ